MELNTIKDNKGARKSLLRVGRGIGSGKGKTAGRGNKGQKSRSGVAIKGKGFEGGQTPLYRRLPKRGFNNSNFTKEFAVINLGDIQSLIDEKLITDTVNAEILKSLHVVNHLKAGLKVLGTGELKSAITVEAAAFSETAKSAIEKVGGKVVCTAKEEAPKAKKVKSEKAEKTTRIAKKLASKKAGK